MENRNNFIQNIILENREKLSVSGVKDILTFDEDEIMLDTELGVLKVTGHNLKVEKLSVDTGEVLAKGEVSSIIYTDETPQKGGFFKSMFK